MTMYWILVLAPSFIALTGRKARNSIGAFLLLFAMFVLAVAFRDQVGMDWSNYLAVYNSVADDLALEDLRHEPSYYLINYISRAAGLGITFVNLLHALFFLGGLFVYAHRKCYEKFLAIAVASPYLVIVIGMSGIRQAAAIGIFMFLLATWDRVGNGVKIVILLFAASFHASAMVLSVLMLEGWRKHPLRLTIASMLVVAGGLYVLAPQQDYYIGSYVENNLESAGALYHSLLVVVPAAIAVLFRRRFVAAEVFDPLIFRMSVIALAVFPLLAVSSTGIDRFLLYFTPVQMYVFSCLGRVFKLRGMAVFMLILNSAILFVWLEYANNSDAWRPYNSCIASGVACFK